MNNIKKPIITAILVALVASLLVLVITSTRQPEVDDFLVMAMVIFLIYIVSTSLIYVVLILMNGKRKKSTMPYSLLFGCFPPAILMLISLRQASIFDIFIILATVSIILWYANYKS